MSQQNTSKKVVEKAIYFTFLLYPESCPEDFVDKLETLDVSIAISPLHDKDRNSDGTFKKPHYHVIYVAKNPVSAESVRKKIKRKLGDKSVAKVQIVDGIQNMYKYLTHESKDAIKKNKYRYDEKDLIELNNFDISRYITLDVADKKNIRDSLVELIDDNNLMNFKQLKRYVSNHFEELGFINSLAEFYDVVSTSVGFFHMVFTGNYQESKIAIQEQKQALDEFVECYDDTKTNVNWETGEILQQDE